MDISVVVSVYERPAMLERVLWGYAMQRDRAFELVIADDGSGAEVRAVVERLRADTGMRIVHVRHADLGFRKSVILNRAIVAAAAPYLIFTDGDCIPRADLVAVHRRLRRRGRYLAGGYLKLPAGVSRRIGIEDVRSGRFADLRWLVRNGWVPGRRALRLLGSGAISAALDRLTPTAAHFHGNNASAWREDLVAVNGFEGAMGYGGLDRALGYRLENAGVRGIQIRHRAVCMHLHHDRPYRDPERVRSNRELMRRIRAHRIVHALQGLEELPIDPSLRVEAGVPVHEPRQGGNHG